jgi:threonine aldolase
MIDLRSDTVTKPTEEMRRAMAKAEVGDDVYGDDPTVNRLEEVAANMLGKEAALFVTSGTQGNQVAVLNHCRLGDEIILDLDSHIFFSEAAAVSAFAGVQSRPVPSQRGAMDLSGLKYAIRGNDIHHPRTGLICLENTHNRAGGVIVPIEHMAETYRIAQTYQIPVHLDGARLFNAAVAANRPAADFTEHVDTVQVCLSKGLGAPIGSMIAGPKEWIHEARRWRKRLGGGLRQAGIIAAAGLIALEKMVDRLEEDHRHAKKLAEGLANIQGLNVDLTKVDTNIVMCDIKDTGMEVVSFLQKLKEEGILAGDFDPYVRFTTHLDIKSQDIDDTLSGINKMMTSLR